MFELVQSMKIDEARNLVLTKYSKRNGETVVCESDHNPMWLEIDIAWNTNIVKDRKEILNLRSKENQMQFKNLSNGLKKYRILLKLVLRK
jgi:hypothetical protein